MEKFEDIYRNHEMWIEGKQSGAIFMLSKAAFLSSNGAEICLPLMQTNPEFHVGVDVAKNTKFLEMRGIIDGLLDGTPAITFPRKAN